MRSQLDSQKNVDPSHTAPDWQSILNDIPFLTVTSLHVALDEHLKLQILA